MDNLVERLHTLARGDHGRGCQGREYRCDCGYDAQAWEAAANAIARITELETALAEAEGRLAELRNALDDLRATPYPPVEDPDDTLGAMLDNQAWIVLSHVAARIGHRDGIEFMELWQDAWAEGKVQEGYFSPHRGVAAWIARHCQLTPEAATALETGEWKK